MDVYRIQRILPLFSICLLVLFAGCGGETPQKQPEPVLPKSKAVEAKPPVTSNEGQEGKEGSPALQESSYQYNPEGRRDPFQSVIVLTDKKKLTENVPPLQRMDLGELKLIGIIWGGFGYNAMLQATDGKGYPVRVGTRIGLNGGRVTKISSNTLIVEEQYTDIFGEKKVREVTMELHPQKERSE
jgi:type IV pilus assembly protein PilP